MKKTRRSVRNGKPSPITAQEAVSLLQSARGYCQQAGIAVRAYNWPDGVTLTLPGVFYSLTDDGTAATFHIGTSPTAKRIGTSEAARFASAQAQG